MTATEWYWGVVVRADAVDALLVRLRDLEPPRGVHLQAPGTGHVTLFYAPLRSEEGDDTLAHRAAETLAATAPFDLTIAGLGEFSTPGRTVAWLGVDDPAGVVAALRDDLCRCDADALPHAFVPHCTVAYGDDPAAYGDFRPRLEDAVHDAVFHVPVKEVWVAGFPAGGHPSRDLIYRRTMALRGA